MNLFTQFLQRTAKRILLTPERLYAVQKLNPEHIYVENIREVLGLNTFAARALCELAVTQGILLKGVEVRCPDEVVAAEVILPARLPETVKCWVDVHGNFEEKTFQSQDLKTSYFYAYQEGN